MSQMENMLMVVNRYKLSVLYGLFVPVFFIVLVVQQPNLGSLRRCPPPSHVLSIILSLYSGQLGGNIHAFYSWWNLESTTNLYQHSPGYTLLLGHPPIHARSESVCMIRKCRAP